MSPDYPWMPNWGCSFPIKLEHLMNFLLTILDHSGEEATVSKLGKTKGCKDQTWNFIIDTGIWDVCRAKTHLCHQNQESLVSAPGGASWSCWSHRSDLQLLVRSVGSHSLCKHQDKLVELIQYSKSVIQWSDYLRKKKLIQKVNFPLIYGDLPPAPTLMHHHLSRSWLWWNSHANKWTLPQSALR